MCVYRLAFSEDMPRSAPWATKLLKDVCARTVGNKKAKEKPM